MIPVMPRRFHAAILLLLAGCTAVDPERVQEPDGGKKAPKAAVPKEEAAKTAPGEAPAPQGDPVDPAVDGNGIAGRVNDEVVTWKDVDDRLKLPAKDITVEMRRSKRAELMEEVLFLQWARKNNITVTEQEIDDQIRRDMRSSVGEEQFDAWLRSTGQTRTEYRERWRRTLLVQKLHWHLMRKAVSNPDADTPGLMQDYVPPEEIREYYEAHRDQYRAIENVSFWRIGLQFSNARDKEGRRAMAESILRKIEEGSDFYMMAAVYSDVWRTTEVQGRPSREFGYRGLKREEAQTFFSPDTVKLLFETLKPGEMSGIVEDGQTVNLFRLEQRVAQREETFEEAQNKIRSYLENRRREESRKRLRNELVKRSYVEPAGLFEVK